VALVLALALAVAVTLALATAVVIAPAYVLRVALAVDEIAQIRTVQQLIVAAGRRPVIRHQRRQMAIPLFAMIQRRIAQRSRLASAAFGICIFTAEIVVAIVAVFGQIGVKVYAQFGWRFRSGQWGGVGGNMVQGRRG